MPKQKIFMATSIIVLSLTGQVATAHLNIAVEDAIAVGDGSREYKEGSGAFVDVNISHDCSDEAGNHYPTTGIEVLLPNGMSVPNTYTANGNTANAVMGVKQRMNPTFEKNVVVKGSVDPFYNHGVKNEDVRVLKWYDGKVDNDHYDNLEFKTTFPSIDPGSCVAKIKMYFPSMQYCTKGYKLAWINTATSKYGMGDAKTHIYDTYAAYLTVVRSSELPESCDGAGETIEIMPSDDEINMYLGSIRKGSNDKHHKKNHD